MGKDTNSKTDDLLDAKADARIRRPRRTKSGDSTTKGASAVLSASATSTGNPDVLAPPRQMSSTVSTASSVASSVGTSRLDNAKERGRRGRKVTRSDSDDETMLVDRKSDHNDDSADDFTPGAYIVSANDSVEFAKNKNHDDDDDYEDIESNKKRSARDSTALVVAAEVVTEKGGMDEEDLALKIAQAVESRLMERDKAIAVAEVVPPPSDPLKGEGATDHQQSQSCSECCIKWKYPIVLLLLGVIGAVIAIVLTTAGSTTTVYIPPPPPPSNSTPPPSYTGSYTGVSTERQDQIAQIIQSSGADTTPFQDPNSPQSLALAWINADPISVNTSAVTPPPVIYQRFALAVFYYSTNGTDWTNQLGFLSDRPVCEWNDGSQIPMPSSASALPSVPKTYGVHCDPNANVKQIRLAQNGLNGTLPWELSLFLDLQALGVDQNNLQGSIPTQLGLVTDMRLFYMETNAMTGTIPTELGASWNALESFRVNDNQLQGSLPTEFGQLANLQDVYVYNNFLSGTVPSQLANNSNVDVMFDPQQVK